jgi:hypothetical protein
MDAREHVAEPWTNGTGQQGSLNKSLGHPIRSLRERIDAEAPLACAKPKYEFKQLAPRAFGKFVGIDTRRDRTTQGRRRQLTPIGGVSRSENSACLTGQGIGLARRP